ncbi:hypothetical protein KC19_VG288400 [Ceratodon purpureus]|uniref:Uncharacterized protein n=1 Tax=Ceratodon purpureus TaxID=3225 RepID=A0A8T0HWG2_CERPU|nr:hypothetical protein KC19_VG288400 [Ceratodon purpureus]
MVYYRSTLAEKALQVCRRSQSRQRNSEASTRSASAGDEHIPSRLLQVLTFWGKHWELVTLESDDNRGMESDDVNQHEQGEINCRLAAEESQYRLGARGGRLQVGAHACVVMVRSVIEGFFDK